MWTVWLPLLHEKRLALLLLPPSPEVEGGWWYFLPLCELSKTWGNSKEAQKREMAFGFITITVKWYVAEKVEAAPSAGCLVCLAAYFYSSPTFSCQGRKKNKVYCQSFLLCFGRVLPDVLQLCGTDGRERRKMGKYGLMKGRRE